MSYLYTVLLIWLVASVPTTIIILRVLKNGHRN